MRTRSHPAFRFLGVWRWLLLTCLKCYRMAGTKRNTRCGRGLKLASPNHTHKQAHCSAHSIGGTQRTRLNLSPRGNTRPPPNNISTRTRVLQQLVSLQTSATPPIIIACRRRVLPVPWSRSTLDAHHGPHVRGRWHRHYHSDPI